MGLNQKKGNEDTTKRIIALWKLHDRMWAEFLLVVNKADSVGASVSIEWSHRCSYHRLVKTRKLVQKLQMVYRKVPGCSVGLVSCNRATEGKPLCKAWGIWINNHVLADSLPSLVCDGSHDCIAVQGVDTEHSGCYTDRFAKILMFISCSS